MNRLKGKVALVTGATRGAARPPHGASRLKAHRGGAGYAIETGMEGLHRDAVGGLIIECTTDMHHSTVSYLLGFPDAAIGAF
ncbi:MAG: hypothetical protein QOC75_5461 [Pseudonocardiales bacterium]|jgi:hypothetical protein|nr:hypothetical protein [Pseudonocardiales bacterium]MDT7648461.1 hypothetical protein [Pseudonocardiales bacterium]